MGGREILFLFIVVFCWGAAPLLEKPALVRTSPLDGLYIRSVIVCVLFSLYYLLSGRFHRLTSVSLKDTALFTGSALTAGFLGMLFYYKLLKLNPVSRTVPLAAVYPLFTAILAAVLLREQVTWQRFLGTVFIALGILLIR